MSVKIVHVPIATATPLKFYVTIILESILLGKKKLLKMKEVNNYASKLLAVTIEKNRFPSDPAVDVIRNYIHASLVWVD